MKKLIFLTVFLLAFALWFAGCSAEPKTQKAESSDLMDDSAVLSSETGSEAEVILPARLIVNGKDITEGNHVYIDVQVCQAEVPLLAILKELGVEIKWQGDSVV